MRRPSPGEVAWLVMVFTTYLFAFYFLPLVRVSYDALDGFSRAAGAPDGRTGMVLYTFLVLASCTFYAWWNPRFDVLMLGITAVNYACGRIIGLPGIGRGPSLRAATAAIVVSLSTLGFFKDFRFLEANLNNVLAWSGAGTVPVSAITLPIGLSFYTVHAISDTIDVHRLGVPMGEPREADERAIAWVATALILRAGIRPLAGATLAE